LILPWKAVTLYSQRYARTGAKSMNDELPEDQRPTLARKPQSKREATTLDRVETSHDPRSDSAEVSALIPGYLLGAELARGGMGIVYEARDLAFDREVAIKMIIPGKSDPAAANRFLRESKITARLPHPGVPPVYAMGTLQDDAPYLAMKLIRGRTLEDLIDERSSPSADLPRFVQIFEQIAQTVGFAHTRGVIHRDLKPSNVMVGEFGEVQVMDWGLAKDLASRERERPEDLASRERERPEVEGTHSGSIMGTPAYMPPEQARGESVDERADVFSLGAILCELLTGERPWGTGKSNELILRAALGNLQSCYELLDGCGADAELISLAKHCLASNATDRHANGKAVAEAVAAYRFGVEERLRRAERDRAASEAKAVELRKRKKIIQIGASVIAAVLILGVIGTSIGMFRARSARKSESEQRELAQKNELEAISNEKAANNAKLLEATHRMKAETAYEKTLDVLDAMVSGVTGDSLSTQPTITNEQKKFLANVLTYYQEFAKEKSEDEKIMARSAFASMRLGMVQERLGRKEEGFLAFQSARDGYEKLVAQYPDRPYYRYTLIQSHNNLAVLMTRSGKFVEAEGEHRQAVTICEKLVADFPSNSKYRRELASLQNAMAGLHRRLGRLSEMEKSSRQALMIQEKLVTEFPSQPDLRKELGDSYSNLGYFANDMAQFAKSIEIMDGLISEFPKNPTYREALASVCEKCGIMLAKLGNSKDAEARYRKALAILEKLVAEFPSVPSYRQSLAVSKYNLAGFLSDERKQTEAEIFYRQSISLLERLVSDFPAMPDYRKDLAAAKNNLGNVLKNLGLQNEAEEQFCQARIIKERLLAEFPDVHEYREFLAAISGNITFRDRVDILAKSYAGNPKDTILGNKVAALQVWFGLEKEWKSTCELALENALWSEDPQTLERMAKLLSNSPWATQDNHKYALVLARKAAELGKNHRWVAYFQMTLGMAEYRNGNFERADAAFLSAMKNPTEYRIKGISAIYHVMSLFRQNKLDEARKFAAQAALVMKPFPKDDNNPLASADVNADDLILWMAYKEANRLIKFDMKSMELEIAPLPRPITK
jgi:serine/threonine protein kinase/Flp pilus assembly protein TadD